MIHIIITCILLPLSLTFLMIIVSIKSGIVCMYSGLLKELSSVISL